jgi:hypothetical protein
MMEWHGDQMLDAAAEAVQDALVECGADLQSKSVQEAPVDTGDLRANCEVKEETLKITVGYGLPYAMKQHEELGYNHPKGGKAKYLEDPFNENADRYVEHIRKKAGDAIR